MYSQFFFRMFVASTWKRFVLKNSYHHLVQWIVKTRVIYHYQRIKKSLSILTAALKDKIIDSTMKM